MDPSVTDSGQYAKASDSGLSVSLHPLVLLTVSDQVTRHSIRKQQGPVVGALLGQQIGREITVEYAFPVALVHDMGGSWSFSEEWLATRIQQYKDVHKMPALDFVGWFTLSPEQGPLDHLAVLQKQAIQMYNEGAVVLVLHPELVQMASGAHGRLPITVYESVVEPEHLRDDGSMQLDGVQIPRIQFRRLPYTIDTDESEMIAIHHVATGAGSAGAVDEASSYADITSPTPMPDTPSLNQKGKKRADAPADAAAATAAARENERSEDSANPLTNEEEDQISNMTTRLNSVKMLQKRILLIRGFLQSLPDSYLSSREVTPATLANLQASHLPHLRNIQALLTRLSLLTPFDSKAAAEKLMAASQAQSNDVALASMLSILSQDVQALSDLGRKFNMIESNRAPKSKFALGSGGAKGAAFGAGAFAGFDEGDSRFASFAGSGQGAMMI